MGHVGGMAKLGREGVLFGCGRPRRDWRRIGEMRGHINDKLFAMRDSQQRYNVEPARQICGGNLFEWRSKGNQRHENDDKKVGCDREPHGVIFWRALMWVNG
ncbi:hypothetical protein ACE6H2_019441 [Prunus campanulata]